ncbi:MAG: fatty acid desaturase [Hyphomicrobium sp.]|nr:fatty acid desaturase [Hyphomicrobium sp.]
MTATAIDATTGARVRPGRLAPEVIETLKSRDNWTNWKYLALNWIVIAATLATSLWAEGALRAAGFGFEAIVPIAFLTIVLIGASQHQLGGAIHEGTHYQLFQNRVLNEAASDWFAGFPIYTSTHHYRLHHMAHHQFVNDTERDPIFAQAEESGHWLDFPLTHIELVRALGRLLWVPNLVKYTLARAKHSALGLGRNPYGDPDKPGHPLANAVGVLFAAGMPAVLIAMLLLELSPVVVMSVFAALWAATVIFYLVIPLHWYAEGRIAPVFSYRSAVVQRISFMAIVYGALTAIDLAGYGKAWAYYGLYWIVPLFTFFPVFMILREWLQHGNADRGRYTNSRIFLTGPLFRYAVMPWGMDYHLPHHLVAGVPHYKLKRFHELLLEGDGDYAAKASIIEGLWGAADKASGRPTAFGALLAENAPKSREEIHIDTAVTERADVLDQAALDRETDRSRAGR